MSRVMVTGGTGFIGHHMIGYLLKNTDHEIVFLIGWIFRNLNRLAAIPVGEKAAEYLLCGMISRRIESAFDQVTW